MSQQTMLHTLIFFAPFFSIFPGAISKGISSARETCTLLTASLSPASAVYYPDDPSGNYTKDISHFNPGNVQQSACSVEPGSPHDISTILHTIKHNHTPFAVKGGGHMYNPGFSSTPGVQISMRRFNEVIYSNESQTVTVGAGKTWDEVYAALEPYNVSLVGGRVPGVGVAGFTLGGGYSWKSNQYGLTLDNLVAIELVQPDGTWTTVSHKSDVDLFWALKGGLNNYGIVTRFTFKAYPQTLVWGGSMDFASTEIDEVLDAVHKYSADVTDPKASMLTSVNLVPGESLVTVFMFYDSPEQPAGIFDDFLSIRSTQQNVKTDTFLNFVTGVPAEAPPDVRTIINTVSLESFSPTILAAIKNESLFWGERLPGGFSSYQIEPFLPTLLSHTNATSAYPPRRDVRYLALAIIFGWQGADNDTVFYDAIRQSAEQIKKVAVGEGQNLSKAPLYPNFAIFDTPLEEMYGVNVAKMHEVRDRVDPHRVMDLTGTWKV
ncbi:FAD dependent oxidoreductase [Flagelloscypha sp. PMI_526]|nr:FAD dependent oxidoreductase [Flagelloscypha sp. PMI_526]